MNVILVKNVNAVVTPQMSNHPHFDGRMIDDVHSYCFWKDNKT